MTKVNTQSTKKVKKEYRQFDIETNPSAHYIECAGSRSSEAIRKSIRKDYYGH